MGTALCAGLQLERLTLAVSAAGVHWSNRDEVSVNASVFQVSWAHEQSIDCVPIMNVNTPFAYQSGMKFQA